MTQTNAQRLADELRAELLVDHSSPYKTVNASKRLLDESATELRSLDAENAQLRAELEAVRRDAERYRWLRSQHEGGSSLSLCVFGPGRVYELEPIDSMPGELDAAIDAAQDERTSGGTP